MKDRRWKNIAGSGNGERKCLLSSLRHRKKAVSEVWAQVEVVEIKLEVWTRDQIEGSSTVSFIWSFLEYRETGKRLLSRKCCSRLGLQDQGAKVRTIHFQIKKSGNRLDKAFIFFIFLNYCSSLNTFRPQLPIPPLLPVPPLYLPFPPST